MCCADAAATLIAIFHTSFGGQDNSAGKTKVIVNEARPPRKRAVDGRDATIG
jgi:hypothetical protein